MFRRADPEHALGGVRVWCDLDLGADLAMRQVPGGWELRLPRPDLDCLEYLLEPAGGSPETDPANPLRVDGAFGEHSVAALPRVRRAGLARRAREPTARSPPSSSTTPRSVASTPPSGSPPTPTDALPLLLAHDGPEMDRFARLTRFVATGIAAGRLPVDAGRAAVARRAQRALRRQPGVRRGAGRRRPPDPARALALRPPAGALGPEPRRPRGAARGLDLGRTPSAGCSSSRARSSPPSSTRRSPGSSSGAR